MVYFKIDSNRLRWRNLILPIVVGALIVGGIVFAAINCSAGDTGIPYCGTWNATTYYNGGAGIVMKTDGKFEIDGAKQLRERYGYDSEFFADVKKHTEYVDVYMQNDEVTLWIEYCVTPENMTAQTKAEQTVQSAEPTAGTADSPTTVNLGKKEYCRVGFTDAEGVIHFRYCRCLKGDEGKTFVIIGGTATSSAAEQSIAEMF